MSYRDPQQAIDNRYAIISQGIAKWMGDVTNRLDTFTAQKQKEKAAYKKVIDKSKRANKTRSDAAFMTAKKTTDKFREGVYGKTKEGGAEEGVLFDDQINGIFGTWGTELNNQITQIQAEGGDESEITDLTNSYIQKVNKFTTDIANWEAARVEYQKAKQAGIEGGYNSVGTLLSDPSQQRNPEIIGMLNAMTDDELDNLYITIDPNGNTRMSLGTITDGKFDAQSSTDLTAWATNHAESPDGKYFITNEQFGLEDYDAMEGILGELENNEALLVNGQLDRDLARDYLLKDEVGRNFMDSFLVGGGVNKWASLYPSQDMSREYTEDDYLGQIFDNTWGDLYAPKQKKAKQSQRNKNVSSTTKAGNKTQATKNQTGSFNYSPTPEDKDNDGVPDYMMVEKDEDGKIIDKKFDPTNLWPKGVPKPAKEKANKIVKKTKNMTKDEIVNLGKEEIAKLTKEKKAELDKLKNSKDKNWTTKVYEGTGGKALHQIDVAVGYPIMAFLMKEWW